MTSLVAVTTPSVPVSEHILRVHAGHYGAVATVHKFGLRGLGYGSRLLWRGAVSLGKALHLYVHSLNLGVNGYQLAGQCLLMCLNSFQCCDG